MLLSLAYVQTEVIYIHAEGEEITRMFALKSSRAILEDAPARFLSMVFFHWFLLYFSLTFPFSLSLYIIGDSLQIFIILSLFLSVFFLFSLSISSTPLHCVCLPLTPPLILRYLLLLLSTYPPSPSALLHFLILVVASAFATIKH